MSGQLENFEETAYRRISVIVKRCTCARETIGTIIWARASSSMTLVGVVRVDACAGRVWLVTRQ